MPPSLQSLRAPRPRYRRIAVGASINLAGVAILVGTMLPAALAGAG